MPDASSKHLAFSKRIGLLYTTSPWANSLAFRKAVGLLQASGLSANHWVAGKRRAFRKHIGLDKMNQPAARELTVQLGNAITFTIWTPLEY